MENEPNETPPNWDMIQFNAPDSVFNTSNQERANKEINDLFGAGAKKSFHEISIWYVKIILGGVMLLITAAVLLVRTWHLLAPSKWCWLETTVINQIDHVILVVFAFLSARFFPNPISDVSERNKS